MLFTLKTPSFDGLQKQSKALLISQLKPKLLQTGSTA